MEKNSIEEVVEIGDRIYHTGQSLLNRGFLEHHKGYLIKEINSEIVVYEKSLTSLYSLVRSTPLATQESQSYLF
jgi:hypothetical protein